MIFLLKLAAQYVVALVMLNLALWALDWWLSE